MSTRQHTLRRFRDHVLHHFRGHVLHQFSCGAGSKTWDRVSSLQEWIGMPCVPRLVLHARELRRTLLWSIVG